MGTLMTRQRILRLLLVVPLLAALMVGLSQAQGSEPPQGTAGMEAEFGVTATVGDAIPIQGQLTDADGVPLDGLISMTFRLYDARTDGVLLCEDRHGLPNPQVVVRDGLFTANIQGCPEDTFNGQELYLSIEVWGDGEMEPRTRIGPVPYARSLRPGAIIKGDVSGTTLWAENTNGETLSYALAGISSGNGTGVYGYSTSGYAGYFFGDVGQIGSRDGLVKAAVYADCKESGSSITQSFNNVAGTIAIADGSSAGRCTIDFGFKISDRYFAATALSSSGGSARGLSCDWGADSEKLDCFRWNSSGDGANGKIMVVIY